VSTRQTPRIEAKMRRSVCGVRCAIGGCVVDEARPGSRQHRDAALRDARFAVVLVERLPRGLATLHRLARARRGPNG
jgi:hypothetical protein